MTIEVGSGISPAEVDDHAAEAARAKTPAAENEAAVTQALARELSTLVLIGCGGAVTLVWAVAVWTGVRVSVHPHVHDAALFLHLASLLVGFGAVLTVDWVAALWMFGRRQLTDVLNLAGSVTLPIWLGLAGLTVSGVFLGPDSSTPLTWVKLGLVLVVGLNGLHAYDVHQKMVRFADDEVPKWLLRRGSASATLSQIGWWTAVVIGFLNTNT